MAGKCLSDHKRNWKTALEKVSHPTTQAVLNYFQNAEPYTTLIKMCTDEQGRASLNPVEELETLMKKAPVYSLDTLALENAEHVKICKFLTAHILADKINRCLFKKDSNGYLQEKEWDFLMRKIPAAGSDGGVQNWLHLFVSMMRNAKRANPKTRYDFISFNYDGIAENVMRQLWSLPSDDLGPFEEAASFHYPHGRLQWVNKPGGPTRIAIDNYEECILFAHNKEHKEGFPAATEALQVASIIISIGFNFAPENVESLEMQKVVADKKLIYQNFDKNEGLDRRIESLPFTEVSRFHGPIAAGIMRGYLGELPS